MSEPQKKKAPENDVWGAIEDLRKRMDYMEKGVAQSSSDISQEFRRLQDLIKTIDDGLPQKIKVAMISEKLRKKLDEGMSKNNSVTHAGIIHEWKTTNSKSLNKAINYIESRGWMRLNYLYYGQKFLFDVNKNWGFSTAKNKIAVDIWNRTTKRTKKIGTDYDSNFIAMLVKFGGFKEEEARRMCSFFVKEFTKWGEPDKLEKNGYRHH